MRVNKVIPNYHPALRKGKASGDKECVQRQAKHVAEQRDVAVWYTIRIQIKGRHVRG